MLKAAVPMLAAMAAQAQGKALVEVCTVYGVATVPLDDGAPAAPHAPSATGDHCVLAAVLALGAAPAATAAPRVAPPDERDGVLPARSSDAEDADDVWRARLGHGPPARA